MNLNLRKKEDCMFDMISLGEIMLRLDPGEGRIKTARSFRAWEGGGEYNVARGLKKCFKMDTGVITAFAENEVGYLFEFLAACNERYTNVHHRSNSNSCNEQRAVVVNKHGEVMCGNHYCNGHEQIGQCVNEEHLQVEPNLLSCKIVPYKQPQGVEYAICNNHIPDSVWVEYEQQCQCQHSLDNGAPHENGGLATTDKQVGEH